MQIKSILAGAAIALIAGLASASAGEMLTLSAIPAEPLTAAEMEQVQGKWFIDLDRSGDMTEGDLVPGGANHPIPGPESRGTVDQSTDILIFTGPIP